VAQFSGNDIRSLSKAHKLSRHELAAILGVSPVTVEKWEQASETPVRSKYHTKLLDLAGAGAAGAGFGIFAAPALSPVAGILGLGAISLSALLTDAELDKASETIQGLKKLTPSERDSMIRLLLKMNKPAQGSGEEQT